MIIQPSCIVWCSGGPKARRQVAGGDQREPPERGQERAKLRQERRQADFEISGPNVLRIIFDAVRFQQLEELAFEIALGVMFSLPHDIIRDPRKIGLADGEAP